jgi:hypothetical protein
MSRFYVYMHRKPDGTPSVVWNPTVKPPGFDPDEAMLGGPYE